MAKKQTKKKAPAKKKASKVKKPNTVKNLDLLTEAEVIEEFKKVVKAPPHDHKRDELTRLIREKYKEKGIVEEQSTALMISPSMKKAGFKLENYKPNKL